MTSVARNLANQANAQLSTGPCTADGKARSAQNACKHGLTATHLVVRDDEREEFQSFLDNLITELQPAGALETITFDHLVHAAWTLRRCRRAETELAAAGPDPFLDETAGRTQDRIVRYAGKAERSYYKALKELRTLQTHRALREQNCLQDSPIDPQTGEQNEAIPTLASVEKLLHIGWDPPDPKRGSSGADALVRAEPLVPPQTDKTNPKQPLLAA